jgi:hypothetical protein
MSSLQGGLHTPFPVPITQPPHQCSYWSALKILQVNVFHRHLVRLVPKLLTHSSDKTHCHDKTPHPFPSFGSCALIILILHRCEAAHYHRFWLPVTPCAPPTRPSAIVFKFFN